ncbi:glycosidase [Opitutaceae bacterium TAV1]|nr:glycosidase [Opitutaceae bacterium TAV1]
MEGKTTHRSFSWRGRPARLRRGTGILARERCLSAYRGRPARSGVARASSPWTALRAAGLMRRFRCARFRCAGLFAVIIGVAATVFAQLAPPATSAPWWRTAVFYQIFVRSFADARSGPLANDGIGDLQGLIERLDYLNDGDPATTTDLGVTAIWLLPINPSPGYHGYDVTDYFEVHPDYGDIALMRRLVAEAHRRGIHVIIDLVLNHASVQHPAFLAALRPDATAEQRDFFRFSATPEISAGPWGQRVWHPLPSAQTPDSALQTPNPDEPPARYYYGVFDAGMPDWNFRNPAVTDHHRRVAKFWLQDIGVDGFRLDAVRYLYEDGDILQDTPETKRWLREFTAWCHQLKPDAFIIGEVWADTAQAASYVTEDGLDTDFEFDLARATLDTAAFGTPGILRDRLARTRDAYGSRPWATFLANHDQERAASQLSSDPAKLRLAAALQFTLPGIPFIYYGEEIGMTGRKPDPDLRTPMQWTPDAPNAGFTSPAVKPWHALNPDYPTINVASQTASPANNSGSQTLNTRPEPASDTGSLLALYRRLIRLRTGADSDALHAGRPLAFTFEGRGLYADLRESETDAILVLANTSTAPRELTALELPDSFPAAAATLLLDSSASVDHSAPEPLSLPLALPGGAILIYHWGKDS